MAYQPATSPPGQHFDAFSPVSPHASMGSDGRRSTHSTPKRRRLTAANQFSFDQGPPFAVPHDAFDAWSPSEEYPEYRHRLPHPPPQPFDSYWDVFASPWADMSEAFPPSFMNPQPPVDRQTHPPLDRQAQPPIDRMSDRNTAGSPPMARYAPPQYLHDLFPRHEPLRSNMHPQTLPVHPSHHSAPTQVSFAAPATPAPAQPTFRKGAIILTLSRATEESIQEIAEHKRECPACQLDFEPDNVLAMIECCNTAMHAFCFSAWVNSNNGPGGSRTKTCMKCRKGIEATRKMNALLPPVDGKSWDEGNDFNAPTQLIVGSPVKFDVSPLPDAGARRQRRREHHAYRARPMAVPDSQIPDEFKEEYRTMIRTHMAERDRLAARVRSTNLAWGAAFDIEARAASIATHAKEALDAGGRITQREVDGLVRRAREAREIQEESQEEWRSTEDELRRLDARQRQVQLDFMQRVRQRRPTTNEASIEVAQTETVAVESRRVPTVTGLPSSE